jgi:Fe-S cluster biosynthesis and repair protein YggX
MLGIVPRHRTRRTTLANRLAVCYTADGETECKMTRTVQCARLGKELPGLKYPPFKGDLGVRIYNEISEQAWKEWLAHSTMVINENRLNPAEPEAQKILHKQLADFLFGGGAARPAGYKPL